MFRIAIDPYIIVDDERVFKRKGNQLKNILLASLVLFIAAGCMSITGPTEIVEIDHIEYTIENQYVSGSGDYFMVWGYLTNVGDTTINTIWNIDVSFYTDSSFTQLLGIETREKWDDIKPGETIFWGETLYPTDEINAPDYPNFAVKDIVFYYNKKIYY